MHPAIFSILSNIVSSAVNSTLDEAGSKAFGVASHFIGKSIGSSIKKNYSAIQKQIKFPDNIPVQSSSQQGFNFNS